MINSYAALFLASAVTAFLVHVQFLFNYLSSLPEGTVIER